MSNCGCGCSGTGNCNQNLNSYNPNNNSTGNFKYDGTAITCANSSNLTTPTGTGLNTVIQNLLNQLCSLSSPSYLAYSALNKASTSAVGVQQQLASVEFVGTKNIKIGEMIRIVFSGQYTSFIGGTSLLFGGRVYSKDSTGAFTSPVSYLSNTVTSSATTVTDNFEYTVNVTRVSDLVLHFAINGSTISGTLPNKISNLNETITGSLTTHDLVLDFVSTKGHFNDIYIIKSITMEHIRP